MTARTILASALMLGLAGCGGGGGGNGGHDSTEVPAAAELVGSYDVTVTKHSTTTEAVGVATLEGEELRLLLIFNDTATVSGPLGADGSIALNGTVTVGDAAASSTGEAHAEQRGGVLRITGHIESSSRFDSAFDFAMERPADADGSVFRGRYKLAFAASPTSACQCSTTAEVSLIVDAGGTGTSSAADELNGNGIAVATFGTGNAIIAPSGRFSVAAPYSTPAHAGCAPAASSMPCAITLRGTLPPPDNGGAVSSTFLVVAPALLFGQVTVSDGEVVILRLNSNG